MQSAGDLVAAALAELPAGVEHGQHDLDCGPALLLHDRDRNPPAVVDDRYRIIGMNRDRDRVAVARQRLVDGVVHDLVDEVVKASQAGRADVHARTAANRLEALQDGDVLGVIA